MDICQVGKLPSNTKIAKFGESLGNALEVPGSWSKPKLAFESYLYTLAYDGPNGSLCRFPSKQAFNFLIHSKFSSKLNHEKSSMFST